MGDGVLLIIGIVIVAIIIGAVVAFVFGVVDLIGKPTYPHFSATVDYIAVILGGIVIAITAFLLYNVYAIADAKDKEKAAKSMLESQRMIAEYRAQQAQKAAPAPASPDINP